MGRGNRNSEGQEERPRRRRREEPQETEENAAMDASQPGEPEEESNYAEDVAIDPHFLDAEFLNQASLFSKYARLESRAKRDEALAKRHRDVVKAQRELAIRADPEKFGLTKVTEPTIKAALALDPEVQEAVRARDDAAYEVNMMIAAVRSFDHRKTALENLVRLHGQEYFSNPNEPIAGVAV